MYKRLIPLFCALVLAHSLLPQRSMAQEACVGGTPTTTITWVNYIFRSGANQVTSHLATQITGDYSDTWAASVTDSETVTDPLTGYTTTTHQPVYESVGYGGNDVPSEPGTIAGNIYIDSPQVSGFGTYTGYTDGEAWSECGNLNSYSYSADLVVNLPAVSGLWGTMAYWNLRPGSSDPQQTMNGVYYYQSVPLTFNTNCGEDDVCTGTPQWTLTTIDDQAVVTATSGNTTTLKHGSSFGSCAYSSTLSANIDGFSTARSKIAYNSPASLSKYGELTVYWSPKGSPGYQTQWYLSAFDACSPANRLSPLPVSENFPSGFSAQNGSTGYLTPVPGNGNYTTWPTANYFYRSDWPARTNQGAQKPAVGFDASGPPYPGICDYCGPKLYLQGAHTFNLGTAVTCSGVPVYTGLDVQSTKCVRRWWSRCSDKSNRSGACGASRCEAGQESRREWQIMCLTHNLLKLFRAGLRPQTA